MSTSSYYSCPFVPFLIDLIVIVPFWRLVSVIDASDYLVIYMIAVNIPYTIRLVPQYINIVAPHIHPLKINSTHPPPLGSVQNQTFFSMMSAFMVITMCYGAFNVLICMVQDIRRGRTTRCNSWFLFGVMMIITQAMLIAIYKYNFISEAMILFLVVYYVMVCGIMAVIVALLLRRSRPRDTTWDKRRQLIKPRFHRFLLFGFIAVVPSVFYMNCLTNMIMEWFFDTVEIPAFYTLTDYMLHPWIFNLAGVLLFDPFKKMAIEHLQLFMVYYRKYCGSSYGSSSTIPAVYRVPPPSYTDVAQKTKSTRPLQMY